MIWRSAAEATANAEVAAVSLKIASNWHELSGSFRLVYEAYLRSELTPANRFGMRVTPYHLLPTTEVFVGILRTDVVSTMTLVRDGDLGLPMEDVYASVIRECRTKGVRLAEVSCLADRRRDFARSLPLVLRMMSFMAQCARRRGVEMLVVAVHPRHAKFYEKFTCFRRVGEEKIYRAVRGKPAVALALDLERAPIDHPQEYRRFFGEPFSEDELAPRPISATLRERMWPIIQASWGSCGNQIPGLVQPSPCPDTIASAVG